MKQHVYSLCDLLETWRDWAANIDSRGTMLKSYQSSDYGECADMLEAAIPTREQILAALSDLNYDDIPRVGDVVPRICFDAVADAVLALWSKS